MATTDLGSSLQHPRRSLGNRHRSQAEKFLRLSTNDKSNISWAEQSATLLVQDMLLFCLVESAVAGWH